MVERSATRLGPTAGAAPAPNLPTPSDNRSIRIFVSSTFDDMVEDRDALLTHAWPELRRFCHERHVEVVEVDLRWGITAEQNERRGWLKLALDEIHKCRPFFVGLLGERYGSLPRDDAFTADLNEEQPWLAGLGAKSGTELEILHGVLNEPEMAGRSFFYFRDPAYAKARGAGFVSTDAVAAEKQGSLKELVRRICTEREFTLREDYPDPRRLADMVLEDLKAAIDAQFPTESIPDALTRDARDHEAFAETRRRTYIGRPDYFEALDRHAAEGGGPLVLLGESGSGKSALLANWIGRWRKAHPEDFVFQHFIGGTPDSAEHWRLMSRLIAEINRWSDDSEELQRSHDDILKEFPVWLAKARAKAAHDGVHFFVVLDALNQLEDRDNARLLGWLPSHPFTGPLRLIVSTLPGDTLQAVEDRGWNALHVEPLTQDERRRVIAEYLRRFGKQLDAHRLDRIAGAPAAANPLYLKILLDELRVTGTHDRLDERLTEYLSAEDIPSLLRNVLSRYEHDYEGDRKGLVSEGLGLIASARRGLTGAEIMRLLRPSNLPQLPLATWTPLRAAIEEGLIDRGGILNFAHDFLRAAVEAAFVPDEERRRALRLQLADDFEAQPVSARSCDELPWLLWQAGSRARLRVCLLGIDRFVEIRKRDPEELMRYWVGLGEERLMGKPYAESFERWAGGAEREATRVSVASARLASFLHDAALHLDAEPLARQALAAYEAIYGTNHAKVAIALNNLALLLKETARAAEAEPLLRRAIKILEDARGRDHPTVATAIANLADLLLFLNRASTAEPLVREALAINERCLGADHPRVSSTLRVLFLLLVTTDRRDEAEKHIRRALAIDQAILGKDHPAVAGDLTNLAQLLHITGRYADAEPLMVRALEVYEASYGKDHPTLASSLGNLAQLLQDTNRHTEAEPFMRRVLAIYESSYGVENPMFALGLGNLGRLLHATNRPTDAELLLRRALAIYESALGSEHPRVAMALGNLAELLKDTNRPEEAERALRRALVIDEVSFGSNHTSTADRLNNLAQLFQSLGRFAEAEPLLRRALAIHKSSHGDDHPKAATSLDNLASLLLATHRYAEAEPLMRRALAVYEARYGAHHPEVATALNNLAQLLASTERGPAAEPLMRRALAIYSASFGSNHPEVATAMNNLGGVLKSTNRMAEAETMLRRALAIDESNCGMHHPRLCAVLNNLALLLQASGRLSEAEPMLRRALAIDERTHGKDHPELVIALSNLGMLLQAMDRLDEAEQQMRRALRIAESSLGMNHPSVGSTLSGLGSLLFAANRLEEAASVLKRALVLFLEFKKVTGHSIPGMEVVIQNYVGVLMASGSTQEQALSDLNKLGGPYGLRIGGG